MLKLYKIAVADAETGEWVTEPEYIGEIDEATHNAREDTDEIHYDMHRAFDGTEQDVAIEVHWCD